MKIAAVYHGQKVTTEDIHFIRALIESHPGKSRRFLSQELCRQWNWRQANGSLKDMKCRGLLLQLHREGLITLPPPKRTTLNPFVNRTAPERLDVDQSSMIANLAALHPIELRSVRKTPSEKLYNSLIHYHHYLGYTYPVGEHLKYIAFSHGRPIACIGWSSAVRHLACRDQFIGWSAHARKQNLHLIAYQTRFLIVPWLSCKNLASYLLGLSSRIVAAHWLSMYHHPVYFFETFVDPTRQRYVS